MFFIPFGKWGVAASVPEDWERYGKNEGREATLKQLQIILKT